MKADFVDVSDTQKTLTVEIPSDLVDAEIERIAKGYARQARLPGFRPGKAPASVIKQRFREQIHHDVMHGLVMKRVVPLHRRFDSTKPGSSPCVLAVGAPVPAVAAPQ